MTIKHLGGVFGRNPTFNDVTIEGTLTFEGNIDIDSDITWEDNKKALFGDDGDLQIYFDGSNGIIQNATSDSDILFKGNDGGSVIEAMRIDMSAGGNVGIGTDSPSENLTIESAVPTLRLQGTSNTNKNITVRYNESNDYGQINVDESGVNQKDLWITALNIKLGRNTSSESARIDSSGNLLVGKSSSAFGTAGTELQADGAVTLTRDGGTVFFVNRLTSDGELAAFYKDGTQVGNLQARGGDLVIGSDDTGIRFNDASNALQPHHATDVTDATIDIGLSSQRFKDLYLSGNAYVGNAVTAGTDGSIGLTLEGVQHVFRRGSAGSYAEQARFDTNGTLLIGKTTASSATEGVQASGGGFLAATRDGNVPVVLNRLTDDGDIASFRKDGTVAGVVRSISGDILIGTGNTGLRFYDAGTAIQPRNTDGSASDNAIDLGMVNDRFKDIYAANGTIQTSDRNEKQDIEELSDAEQRVAVACKGLLRKFRWKSSVADKGDEARIHFGIIAQDLQAAFEAEGLDAGRYGMFINSTWTDEETGEERSRMGVRYSELLAFIISAI